MLEPAAKADDDHSVKMHVHVGAARRRFSQYILVQNMIPKVLDL